jgi:hypothetical protein
MLVYALGAVMILGHCAVDAVSPVGIGVKVPPVNFPALVVTYSLTGCRILELNLSYQRSMFSSISSLGLFGKKFLDPFELGDLTLVPYLGLGVRLTRLEVRVRDQTTTTRLLTANALVGAEYQLDEPPLSIFAEAWNGISFHPAGFGWGGAIGLRVEL